MANFLKYGYSLLLALCCASGLQAQIVYALGVTGQGCQLFAVDVETCEYCAIAPAICTNILDMVVFQDGSFATFGRVTIPPKGEIRTYTPPNYSMTTLDGPAGS